MNLLLLKMGSMRYRGGGGGGGGGGDGGDSGDGIGDGIGPSAGPGAGPGAPGTGPSSNGDVGEGNSSPGADGVDSDVAAVVADMASNPGVVSSSSGNGIAGMLGIDNPTIASITNGIIGNVVSNSVGMPGIVGMANAAINGSPGQAASAIGSAIGGIAAGPVGAAIGGAIGSGIGGMPGVAADSVASDPAGGTPNWTATPTPVNVPGAGAISGGLGMGSTGNATPRGAGVLGMFGNPVVAPVTPVGLAGDAKNDNPLIRALRDRVGEFV